MNKPKQFWEKHRGKGLAHLTRGSALYALRHLHQKTGQWYDRLERQQTAKRLTPQEKELLAPNKLFGGCHQGRRCFVIGNGPSLKQQDIGLLADELTFVMSGFYKHPVVEVWQPHYYFFADPLFFDGSEPMRRFFADLRARIHSTTFFVPLSARQGLAEEALLPLERTRFVKMLGSLENNLSSLPDFTRVVPAVQSVSQMAIMAAMYMGCSPIYLLGLDHDWLAHRGMDKHFYEGKTIENHKEAHGDLGKYSYKYELLANLRLWNGYEAIFDAAAARGIDILNATHGGFLDVYSRVRYEDVMTQAK